MRAYLSSHEGLPLVKDAVSRFPQDQRRDLARNEGTYRANALITLVR